MNPSDFFDLVIKGESRPSSACNQTETEAIKGPGNEVADLRCCELVVNLLQSCCRMLF